MIGTRDIKGSFAKMIRNIDIPIHQIFMKAFWKKKENHSLPNRYKVTYMSKAGACHYIVIVARNADLAREEFLNYYSSPGDVISEVSHEPDANAL